MEVPHIPGHTPEACCFHVPEPGVVFTGDTLCRQEAGHHRALLLRR
nr:MBL fold metallo-hydrolase [Streptomyces alkaliphilus]